MKKLLIVLVALFTMYGVQDASAQRAAVGGELGFNLLARNNANFAFPLGANAEFDINGTLSIAAHMSFDIGLGRGDFSLFYMSPEARYHFSEVFDGAYVGGYIGFGPAFGRGSAFNAFYFSLGASGGYEFMLTENLNLDISTQFGYGRGSSAFGGVSGLHFRPTAALRYTF